MVSEIGGDTLLRGSIRLNKDMLPSSFSIRKCLETQHRARREMNKTPGTSPRSDDGSRVLRPSIP